MADISTVQFDWRVAPDVETMLFKLYTLFVTAGDVTSSKVNTMLSDSRAEGVQKLLRMNRDGIPDEHGQDLMFVRYDKVHSRGWTAKRDKTYWAKWFLVLEDTVIRLSNFTSELQRLTGYKVSRHNFPQRNARKILIDLALTIGIHPAALGSIAAAGGKIMTPRKMDLKLVVVSDILQWLTLRNEPDPGKEFRLSEVFRVSIDAVVVAEHRNLQKVLLSYKVLNRGMDEVIFVLTGGFGDIPTPECLCLLSKHPALAHVPFLYVSDHDFQGFQIFFNLKYGSRNMAFLSQTQTCRQLEWVGPTTKDLDLVAEAGSRFYIEDQAQNHLDWTEEEKEQVRLRWLTKRQETTKNFITKGKGCQINKKQDKDLMKHRRKFGMLESEPAVAEEVLEMQRSKHGKFRLSLLQSIYSVGLQWYIAQQVALRLNRSVGDIRSSRLTKMGPETQRPNNERSTSNTVPSSERLETGGYSMADLVDEDQLDLLRELPDA
ncbi:hypothetical protein EPUS_04041 [Endocarpon pusillum Z07020]|uniref:Topoisomerase 6 subunit A/Spo11 TOPRIM domain-containing protein n=1 Tax=Endocarpon pusillum (strain Z07020 / HMAS-L-300199) TaxID=1263415 RepID=U1GMC9_ENDPU|nr:uncharacterized protein EPUS_04041 [Endocarpon pusillum Z07020]ERF73418.1 hypothetical protein EPUS_04041 [Endocarpon pusillum Z07020]